MTGIQILAVAAPIGGGLFVGLLVFVTNYLDDKKAKAERKARLLSDDGRTPSAAE